MQLQSDVIRKFESIVIWIKLNYFVVELFRLNNLLSDHTDASDKCLDQRHQVLFLLIRFDWDLRNVRSFALQLFRLEPAGQFIFDARVVVLALNMIQRQAILNK